MRHHFAPLGLFVSRFIFPRAMLWAFTFWALGPDRSLHDSEEHLLAESVIKADSRKEGHDAGNVAPSREVLPGRQDLQ